MAAPRYKTRIPRPERVDRANVSDITSVNRRAQIGAEGGSTFKLDGRRVTRAFGTDHNILPEHFVTLAMQGSSTMRLPSAVGRRGRRYRIEDHMGQAATVGAITVSGIAGQTVGGSASQQITSDYGSLAVRSDGSNWIVE